MVSRRRCELVLCRRGRVRRRQREWSSGRFVTSSKMSIGTRDGLLAWIVFGFPMFHRSSLGQARRGDARPSLLLSGVIEVLAQSVLACGSVESSRLGSSWGSRVLLDEAIAASREWCFFARFPAAYRSVEIKSRNRRRARYGGGEREGMGRWGC
ncbi:uncharacterized protein LY79DRAFT_288139 [Colletotrichum navitas]|uniref:Uncharacterized protein n=1 Tax=Colletotrichum navitas TaxID=681940 RepID=A0AAD8QAG3_9PEZI|nr:uncharacterized protein LY79DRAFT_288139 [Colletotrichum navitas]KAK1598421.1 hypothetical protein LY79DRAFT_288139 [Colletotrichum navitas]